MLKNHEIVSEQRGKQAPALFTIRTLPGTAHQSLICCCDMSCNLSWTKKRESASAARDKDTHDQAADEHWSGGNEAGTIEYSDMPNRRNHNQARSLLIAF